MSKDWFFHTKGDGTIAAICGGYDPDLMISFDCFRTVNSGETLDGATYDELAKAGGGLLKIDAKGYEFVKPRRRKPEPHAKRRRRKRGDNT